MAHYKRRNYFIRKDYQGKSAFKMFLSFIVVLSALTLFLGLAMSNVQTMVYDNYHLTMGTAPFVFWKNIIVNNWIFILVTTSILVVLTILTTHKIAGPLFRFEWCLDKMKSKDLSNRIYLRKGDEAQEIGIKFNEFNQMLSGELKRVIEISEDIAASVKSQGKTSSLSDIEELNRKLKEMVSEFKLMED